MLLEYINYSQDFSDIEFDQLIKDLEHFPISTVILPIYYIKSARSKLDTGTKVSCIIDFPFGLSDPNTRLKACEYAIKNKSDFLDIVLQSSLLVNRKYDKLREEIKNIKEFCKENGTGIRYILEYRMFDHNCIKKACEILNSFDITTISLSTGCGLDVLSDAIIANKFILSSNPNLNLILASNFWHDKQIDMIVKNNFYGVRSSYVQNLKNLANFIKN